MFFDNLHNYYDTFEIVNESCTDITDFSDNQQKRHLFLNTNVGIGTNSPSEKLHVNGQVFLGLSNENNVGTLTLGRSDISEYRKQVLQLIIMQLKLIII